MARATVEDTIKYPFSASSSVGVSAVISKPPTEPLVLKKRNWKKLGIYSIATGSVIAFLLKLNTRK